MHTKRDSWRIHDLSVRDYCSHMQFFFSSSLTFQNTIMYNFRRRPGGPSGELLWFIFDRDITFTLGQGDKTVMLAVPAQSPALQSKATVMNLKHSEFASMPSVFLGRSRAFKCMLYFKTKEHQLQTCQRHMKMSEKTG